MNMKTKHSSLNNKFVRVLGLSLSLLLAFWGVAPLSFADEPAITGGPFGNPVDPSEGALNTVDPTQTNPSGQTTSASDPALLDNAEGTLSVPTDTALPTDLSATDLQQLVIDGILTQDELDALMQTLQMPENTNPDPATPLSNDPNPEESPDPNAINDIFSDPALTDATDQEVQDIIDTIMLDPATDLTPAEVDQIASATEQDNADPLLDPNNEIDFAVLEAELQADTSLTPQELTDIMDFLNAEQQDDETISLDPAELDILTQEIENLGTADVNSSSDQNSATPPVEPQNNPSNNTQNTATGNEPATQAGPGPEGSFVGSAPPPVNQPTGANSGEGAMGLGNNAYLPQAQNSGGGGGGGSTSSNQSFSSEGSARNLSANLEPEPNIPGALGSGIPTSLNSRIDKLRVILQAIQAGEVGLLPQLLDLLKELYKIEAIYKSLKMDIPLEVLQLIRDAEQQVQVLQMQQGQVPQVETSARNEVNILPQTNSPSQNMMMNEGIPDQAIIAAVDNPSVAPQFDN